ncbi:putative multidrug resistance protein EmrK [Planctomycetes bacterium Pan216]|uniref:Putative multidrug resistance protein EmrK n=1 Tax=Kolteria novifilia TaxID=2527975 RepID=A0A518B8V9_9BACT|nr:putative multidrug resistance protein EmrK [Planctomycetes bacterium Pan216]
MNTTSFRIYRDGVTTRRWHRIVQFFQHGLNTHWPTLRLSFGAVGVLVLGIAWLEPMVLSMLRTVSTNNAYVASHVTLVSPRIDGQVVEVLVDDNDHVEEGQLLLRLDDRPYLLAVERAEEELERTRWEIDERVAAWREATAEAVLARSRTRQAFAELSEMIHQLEAQRQDLQTEESLLLTHLDEYHSAQRSVSLIERELGRQQRLRKARSVSDASYEQTEREYEQVKRGRILVTEAIRRLRGRLGLNPSAENPEFIPKNTINAHPLTREAVSRCVGLFNQLGRPMSPVGATPDDIYSAFRAIDIDVAVEEAPDVRTADLRARKILSTLGGEAFDPRHRYECPEVRRAEHELEAARLDLIHTEVRSPLEGYVVNRKVSIGNVIEPCQVLMNIRSLKDVWVDANFRETKLRHLRLGQRVELEVDAYPGQKFVGRVAGFSAGTGATLSILPPQNATGNFVKVVQRVPVRIELVDNVPVDTPLFVGLSVMATVDLHAEPVGPDAGRRLRY